MFIPIKTGFAHLYGFLYEMYQAHIKGGSIEDIRGIEAKYQITDANINRILEKLLQMLKKELHIEEK